MKYLIWGLILPLTCLANLEKAPKSFKLKNSTAIYIDIKTIDTEIHYDLDKKTVNAESKIIFNTNEKGQPILDLRETPYEVSLDGKKINSEFIADPDNETSYLLLKKEVETGEHYLIIKNKISINVDFNRNYVSSAFWMSDLTDRKYLEQYIPTNLEYDQFQLNL